MKRDCYKLIQTECKESLIMLFTILLMLVLYRHFFRFLDPTYSLAFFSILPGENRIYTGAICNGEVVLFTNTLKKLDLLHG